jgi:heme a synthase
VLTAVATWVLICFGGLVTSHEAGLAVPDWPNTYGYNLFLFPISKWVGGIFYEHTHRLVASGVGLLTTGLAVWLWRTDSRAWLRWLGVAAVVGVVLQGVLGGLRVVLLRDHLGVLHGALAQLFFVQVCGIALFTSRWWWDGRSPARSIEDRTGLRRWALLATLLVFGQLLLGATMRHRHAGLAIPDFPAAYGRLWPKTDPESVAGYNQRREESSAVNPITRLDIVLQMAHRCGACATLVAVGLCYRLARRGLSPRHVLSRTSLAWLVLVLVQFGLGAATIWTSKSADVATAHVAVGSLILALGGALTVIGFRWLHSPALAPQGTLNRATTVAHTGSRSSPAWQRS